MIDIAAIFRSIINFRNDAGELTISQQNLIKNFRALQDYVPDPPAETAYRTLYDFISDYVHNCDTRDDYELPSYEYLIRWFKESEGDEAVLAVLEKVKVQMPYIGQDYRKILEQYKYERDQDKLEEILTDTNKIAKIGLKDGKGRNQVTLKGIPDALDYFSRKSRKLRTQLTGIKLESQILSKEDCDEVLKEYDKVKRDPTEAFGIYTGLRGIDDAFGGLKNTELMLVNAFTSQGKTTFSMYMAYRAILQGWNTAVISLEQSFQEMRKHIFVKHTCNPKFERTHPDLARYIGTIDVNDVGYGLLTEGQEELYRVACKDIAESNDYGRFFLRQPDKSYTTVSDIEFKLMSIQQELKTQGKNLEFAVIDYISLLNLPPEERSRDTNENTNIIIKQLKQLCLSFNNGKGIRMLSPFQSNRQGWRNAKVNEGVYELDALSNAHEAERSSDVVIGLFIDAAWRDEGKVKISCMKARRNGWFKPFMAKINFKSLFYADGSFDDSVDELKAVEDIQKIVK